MRPSYVLKRFGVFLLVVWAAATVNFVLPRLTSRDPVRAALLQQAATGSLPRGMDETVAAYDDRFGLSRPLWEQYVGYLGDVARLDFRYSIASYPQRVDDMIRVALPWTIALLSISTLLAWAVGSLLGAWLSWSRRPRLLQLLLPPLFALHALPFFVLGLLLTYVLGFRLQLFPLSGGFSPRTIPSPSLPFVLDVVHHAALPALSITLVSLGGWALAMRGLMVSIHGEDYMLFAEAKGLRQRSLFLRYAVRNALLPQTTALALALGQLASGAVLVEAVFSYPGIGSLLSKAIRDSDYYLVQGVVFIVILSIGLATFILDLVYPLLDPRVDYRRA
jgi:peptide/nickel transport system permease protein